MSSGEALYAIGWESVGSRRGGALASVLGSGGVLLGRERQGLSGDGDAGVGEGFVWALGVEDGGEEGDFCFAFAPADPPARVAVTFEYGEAGLGAELVGGGFLDEHHCPDGGHGLWGEGEVVRVEAGEEFDLLAGSDA